MEIKKLTTDTVILVDKKNGTIITEQIDSQAKGILKWFYKNVPANN